MAGHTTTELAQAVRDALLASAALKPATDALYAELGSFAIAQVIDTGAGGQLLVCLPGYGPLDDPEAFVHVAQRAS